MIKPSPLGPQLPSLLSFRTVGPAHLLLPSYSFSYLGHTLLPLPIGPACKSPSPSLFLSTRAATPLLFPAQLRQPAQPVTPVFFFPWCQLPAGARRAWRLQHVAVPAEPPPRRARLCVPSARPVTSLVAPPTFPLFPVPSSHRRAQGRLPASPGRAPCLFPASPARARDCTRSINSTSRPGGPGTSPAPLSSFPSRVTSITSRRVAFHRYRLAVDPESHLPAATVASQSCLGSPPASSPQRTARLPALLPRARARMWPP